MILEKHQIFNFKRIFITKLKNLNLFQDFNMIIIIGKMIVWNVIASVVRMVKKMSFILEEKNDDF